MKKVIQLYFTAFVLILMTSVSIAGDFNDGLEAYADGDYKTAYKVWLIEAEKGVPGAQYNLGYFYAMGLGVPQDDKEAVKWYRMAADQGVAEAQFSLGVMFESGRGVPKDDEEAYAWWVVAAVSGHENALRKIEVAKKQMTTEQIENAQQLAKQIQTKFDY